MKTQFIILGNHRGNWEFHGIYKTIAAAKTELNLAYDNYAGTELEFGIKQNDLGLEIQSAYDGTITTVFHIVEVSVPGEDDRENLRKRQAEALGSRGMQVEHLEGGGFVIIPKGQLDTECDCDAKYDDHSIGCPALEINEELEEC